MAGRITRSARKHRVGADRIREAMAAAGVPVLLDDGKLLYVRTDSRGVELEVVAVGDDRHPGGLAVIHAMPTHYRQEGLR